MTVVASIITVQLNEKGASQGRRIGKVRGILPIEDKD